MEKVRIKCWKVQNFRTSEKKVDDLHITCPEGGHLGHDPELRGQKLRGLTLFCDCKDFI